MASFIRPAKLGETKYVKNNLLIMPLPSKVYLPDQEICFYYEIYDLKKDEEGKTKCLIDYSLISYKYRTKRQTNLESKEMETETTNLFDIGRIKPNTLSPGEYILIIKVTDQNSQKQKQTLTSFKITKG